MPFGNEFDDVYQIGIKEACASAGAYCERVDEQIFHESILSRIYNQIAKADFVVADMTGRNPNVFYEVGYAHALGTPTVLLTRDADDIPFDLKHFPHIIYGSGLAKLREDLTTRVQHLVDNPPMASTDTRIGIDLYLNGTIALPNEEATSEYGGSQYPHCQLSIHNSSLETLSPGDFRIGVVAKPPLDSCKTNGTVSTALPSGEVLHMLPQFDTLLPGAYTSCTAILVTRGEFMPDRLEYAVIVRLFTKTRTYDFNVLLRPA